MKLDREFKGSNVVFVLVNCYIYMCVYFRINLGFKYRHVCYKEVERWLYNLTGLIFSTLSFLITTENTHSSTSLIINFFPICL